MYKRNLYQKLQLLMKFIYIQKVFFLFLVKSGRISQLGQDIQKELPEVFFENGGLKNIAKLTRKFISMGSLLFNELLENFRHFKT